MNPEPGALPALEESKSILAPLDATEDAIRLRLARLSFFQKLFLVDRDWLTRMTMLMVLLSFIWAVVGGADALNVRLQEFSWATQGTLPLTGQEYYAAITQHGIRMFFGFVQQLSMAVFGLLVIEQFQTRARAKWLLYGSVGGLNLSLLLMNGPIFFLPAFNDNYLVASGWYFLSPIGLPGYSSYLVSPLWFWGWVLLSVATFAWVAWMLLQIRHGFALRRAWRWPQKLPVWMAVVVMTSIFYAITYAGVFVASIQDLVYLETRQPFNVLENQVLFWQFGHSLVYALFFLGIAVVYWLIPIMVNRPVYSYRLGLVAVLLYFIFSGLLSIHHLYLAPLPVLSTLLTMAASYGVILPSAITFFTLWLTTKGVRRFRWSTVSLFLAFAWAGVIGAGLEGGAVGTISFDLVVHNTLFVVSHFHAMLLLFIVPAGMAGVYVLLPILTGRLWWSRRLGIAHFVLTTIGMTGFVFSLEELGVMGLLRRSDLFPRVPPLILGEELATLFAFVIGAGQLLFFANVIATAFFGRRWSSEGRPFSQVVYGLTQDLSARERPRPPARAPVGPGAPALAALRMRKKRWETIWIGAVTVGLVLSFGFAFPLSDSVVSGVQGAAPGDAPSVWVSMVAHQYYWNVTEEGAVTGSFNDLVVAYAGESVNFNLTSASVTQALYLPFRSQNVVNVQVVPGYTTHASFAMPALPGVYPMPEAEYDGPWFGLDMADLLVLPAGGNWSTQDVNEFTLHATDWDLYAPATWLLSDASALVTSDFAGLWEGSIPGPTIVAAPGPFRFQYEVPMDTIGVPGNYLVNTTSANSAAEQSWLAAHGDQLPTPIGLWRVGPSGWSPVVRANLTVGSVQSLTATLLPGTYWYGVNEPLLYVYDPYGESGPSSGSQSGEMLALWGLLLVPGNGT